MAKSVFSVPIFFIVFRETLEAVIIVSVLLGLAEQLIHEGPVRGSAARNHQQEIADTDSKDGAPNSTELSATDAEIDDEAHRKRLVRKLRIQVCSCAYAPTL